jgi:hypothetical protein
MVAMRPDIQDSVHRLQVLMRLCDQAKEEELASRQLDIADFFESSAVVHDAYVRARHETQATNPELVDEQLIVMFESRWETWAKHAAACLLVSKAEVEEQRAERSVRLLRSNRAPSAKETALEAELQILSHIRAPCAASLHAFIEASTSPTPTKLAKMDLVNDLRNSLAEYISEVEHQGLDRSAVLAGVIRQWLADIDKMIGSWRDLQRLVRWRGTFNADAHLKNLRRAHGLATMKPERIQPLGEHFMFEYQIASTSIEDANR